MSSPVIPKEHLSAYQRWEMASFGDERPSSKHAAADAQLLAARAAAEEAAPMQEQARQQGYEQGFEQGHAAGLEAGLREGREAGRAEGLAAAAQEAERLRALAGGFSGALAAADETVAADMLNLALDLAKAMLKTALKVRPELVLPVVTEAIRYLPSVQQPALLVLNPQDAEIVRSHIGDELERGGWRLAEDPQIDAGGCRIDTGSNQIDATTPVRWQRIAEALGDNTDWLE
ncbi:flagellar assembly protein FliH [Noviherbaspirillum aridicola]|uniref:Flagellar assembly protein FliH n=1 Tax=Noviherbaspirillum aridicola TaxID=2849687 RepID=A0ABQ4Q7K6_9BURK|nr:flagellar assembly protein FliH [Noviherbaspirillum aridicola]GIZ52684.1 hypothetical protein NCCP691_26980 [Noviherbaspirillum aridicola]